MAPDLHGRRGLRTAADRSWRRRARHGGLDAKIARRGRVSTDDLTWEPPGPGQWYASPEHMPTPVTRLFAELFPRVAVGWARGAERYGLPPNHGTFGAVNCWFYYSPGAPGPVDVDRSTRARPRRSPPERWRGDLGQWHEVLRPAVVASEPGAARRGPRRPVGRGAGRPRRAGDRALPHARRRSTSLRCTATRPPGRSAAGGRAAGASTRASWCEALAGPGRRVHVRRSSLFDRIADGLRAAGTRRARRPRRGAGGRRRCGRAPSTSWSRTTAGGSSTTTSSSPRSPSAREPSSQAIRAALAGRPERHRPTGRRRARSASAVPEADRARFDELVADARAAYGANDDNTTVLFALPLGLVRRAVLEVGRRLVARAALDEPDHALDAERAELRAAPRRRRPRTAASWPIGRGADPGRAVVTPPPVLGDAVRTGGSRRRWGRTAVALVAMLGAFRRGRLARGRRPSRAAPRSATTSCGGGRSSPPIPPTRSLRIEPGDVLVASPPRRRTTRSSRVAAAVAVAARRAHEPRRRARPRARASRR